MQTVQRCMLQREAQTREGTHRQRFDAAGETTLLSSMVQLRETQLNWMARRHQNLNTSMHNLCEGSEAESSCRVGMELLSKLLSPNQTRFCTVLPPDTCIGRAYKLNSEGRSR